jgi:hypothetical protein
LSASASKDISSHGINKMIDSSSWQANFNGSVALLTDCAVTAASVIVQPAASRK